MSEENPYTTPDTILELVADQPLSQEVELASRWSRLWAALIDTLLSVIITVIIVTIFYSDDLFILMEEAHEISANSFVAVTNNEEITGGSTWLLGEGSLSTSDFRETFMILSVYFAAFMVLNGYLLIKSGQTIGKKLLKIQIVCSDTKQLLNHHRMIGLRTSLPIFIGIIPIIADFLGIIDVLFIFTKSKRCLHDRLANSIVIKKSAY